MSGKKEKRLLNNYLVGVLGLLKVLNNAIMQSGWVRLTLIIVSELWTDRAYKVEEGLALNNA